MPRLRQRKGTNANTVFFYNNNSSGSEIIFNRWQYFQQDGCQALRTIVLETERDITGLGVASTYKKCRVIEVLGDSGSSIKAGMFKNDRIQGILREYIADADNIASASLENSDGARGNMMIGQVTHDLRRVMRIVRRSLRGAGRRPLTPTPLPQGERGFSYPRPGGEGTGRTSLEKAGCPNPSPTYAAYEQRGEAIPRHSRASGSPGRWWAQRAGPAEASGAAGFRVKPGMTPGGGGPALFKEGAAHV